ncbi:MAG: hypothetical protein NWF07_01250 [Candidatus Bathyarchaeota archaeon]|nr:hypothetical protein [Candidatus Bathyarchaeota archaeon]
MRPSDKTRWIQVLVFMMLVTPIACTAITPNERRWETADLIIEGRILETKTIEEEQVSIVQVDRILKTETIEMAPSYAKGSVAELEIQIPASNIDTTKTHIIFLEETDNGYEIIYSEKSDTQVTPQGVSPEVAGFTALIILTLSIHKIEAKK